MTQCYFRNIKVISESVRLMIDDVRVEAAFKTHSGTLTEQHRLPAACILFFSRRRQPQRAFSVSSTSAQKTCSQHLRHRTRPLHGRGHVGASAKYCIFKKSLRLLTTKPPASFIESVSITRSLICKRAPSDSQISLQIETK